MNEQDIKQLKPYLLLWSGHRHENLAFYTQLTARISHPLSMVAGTARSMGVTIEE